MTAVKTIDTTDGIPCMLMRGGTVKAVYFRSQDLPAGPSERNDLLLRIMGSPDRMQIDGLGGGQRHSSKVAVVSRSQSADADIDYLFLQVQPAEAVVTDRQTCGNTLAGVAPFVLERGLHPITETTTDVRIRVLNDDSLVVATVQTRNGKVVYGGQTELSGVPFPAAAISLRTATDDGPILPTGSARNACAGVDVTCMNAGKPYVLIRASDLGVTGYESPTTLEGDAGLRKRLEAIRQAAGPMMGLGDVSGREDPKLALISPARAGGTISTRIFTPHTCHPSIGALGAVSVAAGARVKGSVAEPAESPPEHRPLRIEHPAGYFDVDVRLETLGAHLTLKRVAIIQTARKIFDGRVWPRDISSGD